MIYCMQLDHMNPAPHMHCQEGELIEAAKEGDLEAFNIIVLKYQDLLFRIAYRIFAEEDPAYDAVQDAFLSAFQQIQSVRGDSMKAWLIRIVVNKCKDQLRAMQRHPTQSLDRFFDADLGNQRNSLLEVPDKTPSVERFVESAELERIIQNALYRMPVQLRTTLILADIEGFSYDEIATIERIPMGTVKSRLVRARLQLRGLLLRQASFVEFADRTAM